MIPLLVSDYTLATCLGHGVAPTRAALEAGRSGLVLCEFETAKLDTWIGVVAGLDAVELPAALQRYHCRNGRLALLGLQCDGFLARLREAILRYGARRVAVLIGTSSSGILDTEIAFRSLDPVTGRLPANFDYAATHNLFAAANFLREFLGLEGPAATISTACSSSAKVFAAAARLIEADVVDAALVGGIDALCLTTLYGFTSLELTARGPCRPFDENRNGISIGEAVAYALLERVPDSLDSHAVLVAGAGESGDAYHMSAPHPEGLGARLAMQKALAAARLEPDAIDYINLHGTATPANDASEGRAVNELFGSGVACSSTKGATGHALGAAGAVEALVCAIALEAGTLPASANTQKLDSSLELDYLLATRRAPLRHALTNSFGFGGSNCSLVLSRAG
jgi:3-oxoacyl-[acyl-carrier-protein] synthase I